MLIILGFKGFAFSLHGNGLSNQNSRLNSLQACLGGGRGAVRVGGGGEGVQDS